MLKNSDEKKSRKRRWKVLPSLESKSKKGGVTIMGCEWGSESEENILAFPDRNGRSKKIT
jgi:hypothetical protein